MTNSGYEYIYRRNSTTNRIIQVHEHVFVCLSKLGLWQQGVCKTPKGYHVHHKDFSRTNNSPDNLELVTIAEHNKIHKDKLISDGIRGFEQDSNRMKKYYATTTPEQRKARIAKAKAKQVENLMKYGPNEAQLGNMTKARAALKEKRDAERSDPSLVSEEKKRMRHDNAKKAAKAYWDKYYAKKAAEK